MTDPDDVVTIWDLLCFLALVVALVASRVLLCRWLGTDPRADPGPDDDW